MPVSAKRRHCFVPACLESDLQAGKNSHDILQLESVEPSTVVRMAPVFLPGRSAVKMNSRQGVVVAVVVDVVEVAVVVVAQTRYLV